MNRNQKIAIGCGGAGCFGLLLVAVAAVGVYLFYQIPPTANRNSNIDISTNRGANGNTSTDPSDEKSSFSSMSDDDKHKLFQAATAANDIPLMQKVFTSLGLFDANGSYTDEYSQFIRDHASWTLKNSDFIRTVDTPEKAKAYVDAHLDD